MAARRAVRTYAKPLYNIALISHRSSPFPPQTACPFHPSLHQLAVRTKVLSALMCTHDNHLSRPGRPAHGSTWELAEPPRGNCLDITTAPPQYFPIYQHSGRCAIASGYPSISSRRTRVEVQCEDCPGAERGRGCVPNTALRFSRSFPFCSC